MAVHRPTIGTVVTAQETKDGQTLARVLSKFLTTCQMVNTLFNGCGSVKATATAPTVLSKAALI